MRIGFTGTREGMTELQHERVKLLLAALAPVEFHHGCCIGADTQAAIIAFNLKPRPTKIVGHPSDLPNMTDDRALDICTGLVCEPLPPLIRNQNIVVRCDLLIATPVTATMRERSGTWATIRMAWRTHKPTLIIQPNGKVKTSD